MSTVLDDGGLRDALVRMSFEVMGRLTRVAAEEGMSLTQLRLLGVLRDRTPRMAELAAGLGLDRSSVTGLVDRAQRRGLVERIAGEGDARVVRVGLTEAGAREAKRVAGRVSELLVEIVSPLADGDRVALQGSLERAFAAPV